MTVTALCQRCTEREPRAAQDYCEMCLRTYPSLANPVDVRFNNG